MKYGIIIQDLDRDQVDEVLAKLDGEAVAVVAGSTSGNEGEFDSKGMPWDERIHAGTKAKNKDGSWKARRSVDDATVAAVESELRLATAQAAAPAMPTAPAAPVAPTAPAAPAAPVAGETIDQKIAHVEQNMGIAPAAPAAPAAPVAPAAPLAAAPAPAAPAAAPTRDFNGLMGFISNLFRTNAITTPEPHKYPDTIVARINQGFNVTTVTTLTDIANDANMVNYAWQCIDVDTQAGLIKKAA